MATLYLTLIVCVLVVGIAYIAAREIHCMQHPPDRTEKRAAKARRREERARRRAERSKHRADGP